MDAATPASTTTKPRRAVCFTAGFEGAAFAAGAIHAYLASDQPPPLVAAGVSMGAVSAAVMQRSFRELEESNRRFATGVGSAAEVEAARWASFRRYLLDVSDSPLDVLWNGIPNQKDFFADLPPVTDPVPETYPQEVRDKYRADEAEARRELYLFVKLGHWIARLPITLALAGYATTFYVRAREQYPFRYLQRRRFWIVAAITATIALVYLLVAPNWFPEWRFREIKPKRAWQNRYLRPLFGWPTYSAAWVLFAIMVAAIGVLWKAYWPLRDAFQTLGVRGGLFTFQGASALLLVLQLTWLFFMPGILPVPPFTSKTRREFWFNTAVFGLLLALFPVTCFGVYEGLLIVLFFAAALLLLVSRLVSDPIGLIAEKRHSGNTLMSTIVSRVSNSVLDELALRKSLVHSYHLRQRLIAAFGIDVITRRVNGPSEQEPTKAVLVAAPLQTLKSNDRRKHSAQMWAAGETSLLDALVAALSLPGILPPFHVPRESVVENAWDGGFRLAEPQAIDLVDGSTIRQNPLPALFNFIKQTNAANNSGFIAEALAANDCNDKRVQVIYSVPIERRRRHYKKEDRDDLPDVVEAGQRSVRLSKRRDTQLEVAQANHVGRLELEIRKAQLPAADIQDPHERAYPIFVDEIAPSPEVAEKPFENRLAPTSHEFLRYAAHGCQRTLAKLCSSELVQLAKGARQLDCAVLLRKVANSRPVGDCRTSSESMPGCAEVCRHCSGKILVPQKEQHAVPSALAKAHEEVAALKSTFQTLRAPGEEPERDYSRDFPALKGSVPRIVFITSGGVFRGCFHIGMIGAMQACEITPDLIVGASVGTLMAGALAGVRAASTPAESLTRLHELVTTFLHVDERVALTAPFKNAVRELGLRMRQTKLSPRMVRRMLKAGSRRDAGFAATGAPPAVIDAISNLFLLPHRATSKIAADFVAGHVTSALHDFLRQVRRDTLKGLGIKDCVLGTSLLQPTVTRLLAIPEDAKDPTQPFLAETHYGIAIMGTATDLLSEQSLLLGSGKTASFDFIQAALASSAFPCVFAPRRQADVTPGLGRTDVFYSDGGMFDNLPFIPAIELLRNVQCDYQEKSSAMSAIEFIHRRLEHPDLFITGALNANPSCDANDGHGTKATLQFTNLAEIYSRGAELANNLKIRAFENSSNHIDAQLQRLGEATELSTESARWSNGVVNAAVLPVFPANKKHLNGTFNFCSSLNLSDERVSLSIADGCFQTVRELYAAQAGLDPAIPEIRRRSVRGLQPAKLQDGTISAGRVPLFNGREKNALHNGECKFFQRSALDSVETTTFSCPFYEMGGNGRQIYDACTQDPMHAAPPICSTSQADDVAVKKTKLRYEFEKVTRVEIDTRKQPLSK